MILSDAKRNELAVMAFLVFGCTCDEAAKHIATLRSYLGDWSWELKPIATGLATYHFRKCVYEKSLLIRQKNGELVFTPGGERK